MSDTKRISAPRVDGPETEPWRELLLKAADVIRESGWCQHSVEYNGTVCLFGAMLIADGCNPWDTLSPLSMVAANQLGGITTAVNFNDTPGRTADEVIAALEGAARKDRTDG